MLYEVIFNNNTSDVMNYYQNEVIYVEILCNKLLDKYRILDIQTFI